MAQEQSKESSMNVIWSTVRLVHAMGAVGTALVFSLFLFCFSLPSSADNRLQEGDIVFQTSFSQQTRAIQLATHSPYSHVGVLLEKQGRLMVFEAGPRARYTALDKWIANGERKHYVVKRLDREAPLTAAEIEKLRNIANTFEGRPYDRKFEWSDSKLYCSELVWKLYHQALSIDISAPKSFRDFDLASPVVKKELERRFDGEIPLNETAVAPGALYKSSLLREVYREN